MSELIRSYLAHAEEADRLARTAATAEELDAYLRIAATWREMAETRELLKHQLYQDRSE